MLTISQKRFFVSLDELALVCGTWFRKVSDRRGETGIPPPLEIGLWTKYFWKKLKSV